jgi:LacI family transcriptional regulator/LacI family repressor for deo operon, udp, cdd, tsx, nupC, and nupG
MQLRPAPAPRPTQPQIARSLRLSQSTVSLALRGDPRVAAATREAVAAAAQRLGYVPDPMLHALTARRHSPDGGAARACLAWLTHDPATGKPRPVEQAYLRGAKERAETLGFRVETFRWGARGMTVGRMRDILLARGVRGLLLPPQPEHGARLDFDFSDFSAVAFGYTLAEPRLNFVCSHHARSLVAALHRLRDRGYRRIGLLVSKRDDVKLEHTWLAFYLGTMAAEGWSHPPPLLATQDLAPADVVRWVRRHRVDAVLAGATLAEDCVEWLRTSGLAVPQDVAVASINTHGSRQLAGIDQRIAEVGRAAVEMLAGMLHRFERGIPPIPRLLLIEGEWREGPTVGPPPPVR